MAHKQYYIKSSDYNKIYLKKLSFGDVEKFNNILYFQESFYRYILELDNNLYCDDFPSRNEWILQEFIPPNILVFSYNFYSEMY